MHHTFYMYCYSILFINCTNYEARHYVILCFCLFVIFRFKYSPQYPYLRRYPSTWGLEFIGRCLSLRWSSLIWRPVVQYTGITIWEEAVASILKVETTDADTASHGRRSYYWFSFCNLIKGKIQGPGPPGWGSLKFERVKYGYKSRVSENRE
jgi:hypothetical protein